MDFRVECPYCDNMDVLNLESYNVTLTDFQHDPRVENLSHICDMCNEQYTFDVELDVSTMSFTDEYIN